MSFLEKINQVITKDRNHSEKEQCYEHLCLTQKNSASQLRQFGFELKSVHGEVFESIAIFTSDSLSVTVAYLGENRLFSSSLF